MNGDGPIVLRFFILVAAGFDPISLLAAGIVAVDVQVIERVDCTEICTIVFAVVAATVRRGSATSTRSRYKDTVAARPTVRTLIRRVGERYVCIERCLYES
jgi:hypothetical protein